ncbi:hypothetical protein GUITHDRAFT_154510 [Guillardia theta CCMP2712]|uniref:PDZ domain-containing protein n=2 Tax=Guillardia theta TaxID=55529 RepID=L1IS50_GUITC|nr:hypothetical protein GUITHDRAFT_154510 [Guillardia theta CCMP2712]EKX39096.1 hypothetical protein GUITHDRAFT_154510 [Guillardia theta CCMP2712]|eukprot:XP_005826076.1 hypothetical protein GUITHDRAFT_154510 [Guillardia theta CCMP2712]
MGGVKEAETSDRSLNGKEEEEAERKKPPSQGGIGLAIALTSDNKIVVADVKPDSSAGRADPPIKVGDEILKIGGVDIGTSLSLVYRLIADKEDSFVTFNNRRASDGSLYKVKVFSWKRK